MPAMKSALLVFILMTFVKARMFYLERELEQSGDKTIRRKTARKTGRGKALSTWDCQNIAELPDDIRAEFPLDNFYQKYTHAYGIPIISSQAPQDAALTRACYTVRFLLADRKDLRDAMYDSYGRVGVIGEKEKTTDIPEHSYLSDAWNDRARGLGGTQQRPITTDGEENLLCMDYWHDRWWEEDVMVHEFAHAIHLISLEKVDHSFKRRLQDTFNDAKAKALWPHTYAGSRSKEYFAEGVQKFFNVEVHRDFRDNVHNNISTRQALYDYDRSLYYLIEEVFPCKNDIVDRCDDQDLAASQILDEDCSLEPDAD